MHQLKHEIYNQAITISLTKSTSKNPCYIYLKDVPLQQLSFW